MTQLIAAALVFLGIHLFISGTRLRDTITATIGEGPYMGAFVVASFGIIFWMAHSYNVASESAGDQVLYDLGRGLRDSGILIVGLAFLLGVQGLFVKNPTRVRMEGAAGDINAIRGVVRITRHPFMWGIILWSAFHVAVNGDLASVIFFGTFLILALFGTYSIDAKRRRKLGPAWDSFAAKTSDIPFGAIAAGRNRFVASEVFGWRFWAAAAIFLTVLFAHPWLFGVSPFPNGWSPY